MSEMCQFYIMQLLLETCDDIPVRSAPGCMTSDFYVNNCKSDSDVQFFKSA